MAISLNPTLFPNALRNKNFTLVVNAVGNANEIINSVNATLLGDEEKDLKITSGTSSFTISGFYQTGFLDNAKYVSKEGSDKLETPIEVTNLSDIPEQQSLYVYKPDSSTSITRTLNITVTYNSSLTQTFVVTQKVDNDIRNHTPYLQTYYGNTNPYVFTIAWSNNDGERVFWTNLQNEVVEWKAD